MMDLDYFQNAAKNKAENKKKLLAAKNLLHHSSSMLKQHTTTKNHQPPERRVFTIPPAHKQHAHTPNSNLNIFYVSVLLSLLLC